MSVKPNLEGFHASLKVVEPPMDWNSGLRSMWYDVQGNWDASHDIAQNMSGPDGSWIHAYLHRKEGDKFNAEYWYRKAQKSFPKISIADEQKTLVAYFIDP
ncbi:hypothetical protein [Sediminicola sp. 1XM1-17]|uniref:hypothetical protein n=1 Tax=Sediminicola sp. 1XM1-17 TaxID=3127702 RepID=UPI003077EFB6